MYTYKMTVSKIALHKNKQYSMKYTQNTWNTLFWANLIICKCVV